MKIPVWIFSALLLLFLAGCVFLEETPHSKPFDPATVQQLDQIMAESMAAYQAPGMILWVYDPNKGEYFKAVGTAEISSNTAMSVTPLYRIGSLTKTFTGTVVLQLIDEGVISLESTVDQYISGVPSGESITIKMLLNMTSGLPNYTESAQWQADFLADPHRNFRPEELLAYAFSEEAHSAPGAGFFYTNTNIILLGLIIEEVDPEGDTAGAAIKRRIIDPLGLNHTSFPTGETFPGEYIHGYVRSGAALEDCSIQSPSFAWTAGAIISNVADIRTYIEALGTGKLLSASLQAQRMSDWNATTWTDFPSSRYGLGWYTLGGFVGHSGHIPGYLNIAMYDPETGTVILVLLNTSLSDTDSVKKIFREVLRIFFPERTV